MRDGRDRHIRLPEQPARLPDPVFLHIILGRYLQDLLEHPVQIAAADPGVSCNILDRNGIGIVLFDIADRLLDTACLQVLLLGLRRRIFHQHGDHGIQRAGHGNRVIKGIALCLVHLLDLPLDLTADLRLLQHRGLLRKIRMVQKVKRVGPGKAHPGIDPGFFLVGPVTCFHIWIDQKGISFFQIIGLSPDLKMPFSAQHMVEQIMVAHPRPPLKSGRTFLASHIVYRKGA